MKNKHTKDCQLGNNSKDCHACKEIASENRSNPLEKVIEQKVCDYAKSLGCLAYKFTSPSRRSVPDRLFVVPEGKGMFFIEFKRLGQKPTPAQAVEIAKLRSKGAFVAVVDNVEIGKRIIGDMMYGYNPMF